MGFSLYAIVFTTKPFFSAKRVLHIFTFAYCKSKLIEYMQQNKNKFSKYKAFT